MRYISDIFRDLLTQGIVLPCIDDLVFPATNESEEFERLTTVFVVTRDYGLEINFNKCQFSRSRTEFLDHMLTALIYLLSRPYYQLSVPLLLINSLIL